MRIFLATLLMLGLVASPARAEELSVRVVRQGLRRADDSPRAVADPLGARIDFGVVSVSGPPPRTVRRYATDGDGAHFVASFELEIVATGSNTPSPPTLPGWRPHGTGRPGVDGPQKGFPEGSRRLAPAPSAPVNLYASLAAGDVREGDVRIAVGSALDWGRSRDVGTPLGLAEVPVAFALQAGDRIRCEVSLYASASAVGQRAAVIRFDVR